MAEASLQPHSETAKVGAALSRRVLAPRRDPRGPDGPKRTQTRPPHGNPVRANPARCIFLAENS